MPKQTVIRPSGVVTQPNEYGELPPGTLSVGDNIQIRRASVLEPRNAFEVWQDFSVEAVKIWEVGEGLLLSVFTNAGGTGACLLNGLTVENLSYDDHTYSAGKTFISRVRDRVVFTNDYAPGIFDPRDGAPYVARQTGLPPPVWIDIDISSTATDGMWLLADNLTAYRAVYKRKFDDGYVVTSSASLTVASNITPADCLPQITIYNLGNFSLQAGDLIELYRVPQQENLDLLGGDFRLATVHELTSGEVTAGFATFYDVVLEDQLGAYLYTNAAQEGPSKQNYMPPPSVDVVTFKKATFYVSPEAWHAITVTLPGTVDEVGASRGFGGPSAPTDSISIDGDAFQYPSLSLFMEDVSLAAANGDTDVIVIPNLVVSGDTGAQGVTLTFLKPISGGGSFTLTSSKGSVLMPPIPGGGQESQADPRTNRVHYSKIDQPEAVPPDNTLLVGSGTILKLWATQDSLFAFCTDGIYRIDGDGDDWRVRPFDPDTILLAPDAVDSLDNRIYAWTTAGLVSVTDSDAVQKISAPRIDEDLRDLWTQFRNAIPYTWDVQLACDKYRSEVWLSFNDLIEEGFAQTWIWNTNTDTFVTQSAVEATALGYAPSMNSMVLGDGADNIVRYDPDNWMETNVEFNSVFAEDLGLLKQWIDVTLFFEDLSETGAMTPRFEGVDYDDSYTISATAGAFDHVIAPLLTAVMSKHIRFGYLLEAGGDSGNPYYKLKGLTYRYRLAAEPLRR